ncbi:MAG: response regulator [Candidatus Tectomicrobia bacterium]|nr:response regulator [Candidatus Tectomicrobia bacterium]
MEQVLTQIMPNLAQAKPQQLLLVDDEVSLHQLYSEMLTNLGHTCVTVGSAEEALEKLETERFDVMITDINLPAMDGLELLAQTKQSHAEMDVIVVTGYGDQFVYNQVINAGASDFLTKPFRVEEMEAKLNRVIRERSIIQELTAKNARLCDLEKLLSQRLKEISVTQGVTVATLARIAEHRDPMITGHLDRMQRYSVLLAQSLAEKPSYLGEVDDEYIQRVEKGSILHDIGKIGIPEGILLKPGHLTDAEWVLMKLHTTIGAAILGEADQALKEVLNFSETFLTMATEIALHHHERWDGKGYPLGLTRRRIPLCARIVILADMYDALTSRRCYKPAFSHAESRAMIVHGSGTALDPAVVACFLEQEENFDQIRKKYQ